MQKSASTPLASGRLRPRSETAKLPDIPTGLLTHFVLKALQESRSRGSAFSGSGGRAGESTPDAPAH